MDVVDSLLTYIRRAVEFVIERQWIDVFSTSLTLLPSRTDTPSMVIYTIWVTVWMAVIRTAVNWMIEILENHRKRHHGASKIMRLEDAIQAFHIRDRITRQDDEEVGGSVTTSSQPVPDDIPTHQMQYMNMLLDRSRMRK